MTSPARLAGGAALLAPDRPTSVAGAGTAGL